MATVALVPFVRLPAPDSVDEQSNFLYLERQLDAIRTSLDSFIARFGSDDTSLTAINTSITAINADIAANEAVWSTYTPVVTGASGSLTSYAAFGRYKQIGKTVHINIAITITTNGTAAGGLFATLPTGLPMNSSSTWGGFIGGRERFNTGKQLQGLLGGTSVLIQFYDGTHPGANGSRLVLAGTYETD